MKIFAKISIILSLVAISIVFTNAFRRINNFKNGTVAAATVNYLQLVDNFEQTSDGLFNLTPTGYVNDYQNLFTQEQRDTLEKMMSEYEKKTSIEFCLVTYWIEPEEYSEDQIFDLGTKWGVGKSTLDNGFLMFLSYSNEPGQSNYFNATGRGLDAFLPDATVNKFNYSYLLPKFKTHSIDEIFEGYKEFIIACQEKLGDEGYDMLVKNKEIRDAEIKEKAAAFFRGLLEVLFVGAVLFAIGFLIYLQIKKRKKFLKLKNEIIKTIDDINKLKVSLNGGKELPFGVKNKHQMVIARLSEGTFDKVTKKMVTEDNKMSMKNIYNGLLDYKTTIDSINNSVSTIKKTESFVKDTFKKSHSYCDGPLKSELLTILSYIDSTKFEKMIDDDFNMEKRYKLMNIESNLENKVNSFMSKVNKIDSITTDYKNVNSKLKELEKSNMDYIRKRNILSGAKIGNKFNSLVNIKFDESVNDITSNITDSMSSLESDDLNSALNTYGKYVTGVAVLVAAFSAVDSLYSKYEESVKYIKDNKSKIDDLVSKVESKSHKSGVNHSHKKDFSDSKSDIKKFDDAMNVDVILAATLLISILKNLKNVYEKMKSAISSYESRNSYRSSSSSSSSYRSSGSSFGGFGGGSFGGGGAGGKF